LLLWARIERELRGYFSGLYRQGALRGASEEDAFYVKCDAETNPPDAQALGAVVTEVGLAPAVPHEFVVVRLVHGASGLTITGPARPG
jgi:phage tail sheath protein FI